MIVGLQEDVGPKVDKVLAFSPFFRACATRLTHFFAIDRAKNQHGGFMLEDGKKVCSGVQALSIRLEDVLRAQAKGAALLQDDIKNFKTFKYAFNPSERIAVDGLITDMIKQAGRGYQKPMIADKDGAAPAAGPSSLPPKPLIDVPGEVGVVEVPQPLKPRTPDWLKLMQSSIQKKSSVSVPKKKAGSKKSVGVVSGDKTDEDKRIDSLFAAPEGLKLKKSSPSAELVF
jgi:hypothetical protein